MNDIFTAEFWRAASGRALRTFAQTLLVFVGGDAVNVISATTLQWIIGSLFAAFLSVLTSIVAGIPEVETAEEEEE